MTDDSLRDVCPNPDDPEYVELYAQYIHSKDQCHAKEMELREMYGPNARLDNIGALEARLTLLTNHLLPLESKERVKFEIEWQGVLRASLEQMHVEIREHLQRQAAENKKKKIFVPGTDFRLP